MVDFFYNLYYNNYIKEEERGTKMNKTIYDSTCPKCGSDNWYSYDTDEIEFSDD